MGELNFSTIDVLEMTLCTPSLTMRQSHVRLLGSGKCRKANLLASGEHRRLDERPTRIRTQHAPTLRSHHISVDAGGHIDGRPSSEE